MEREGVCVVCLEGREVENWLFLRVFSLRIFYCIITCVF